MNLREAAQQALEALEYIHTETSAYEDELIHAAIIALRAALEPVTTCHELYETACANATYKVIDYFCHTTACSDVNVTYIRKILDEFAEQAICCKGGDKLSLPFDHFPDAGKMVDVQQEMDCYGDGNVYRGQRSSDSKTQTITVSALEKVEPVAFINRDYAHRMREVLTQADFNGDKAEFLKYCMAGKNLLPLYTAPPKHKPLTGEEISKIFIYCGRDKETFARAIERAHGIGGEE